MKTAINIKGLKENTTIKELNEMEKTIKELNKITGEDVEFNFNDLDNQEDFKDYTFKEYLKEQYADELRQIKEKGIINNREMRNGKKNTTKDLFKSLGVEHYE